MPDHSVVRITESILSPRRSSAALPGGRSVAMKDRVVIVHNVRTSLDVGILSPYAGSHGKTEIEPRAPHECIAFCKTLPGSRWHSGTCDDRGARRTTPPCFLRGEEVVIAEFRLHRIAE